MPERNPLTDPQAGDKVVALNGKTRHVVRVVKNDIYFKMNENGKLHKCWRGQWLEWCQQNVA